MARIRTIKPEFWVDDEIVELGPWTRLLFIGLWNFVDDEGYIEFKSKRIKMQVFPADDVDMDACLNELIQSARVEVVESDQGSLLRVVNWARHQKISNPTGTKFTGVLASSLESSVPLAISLERSVLKGREGKGIEGKGGETRPPRRCPEHLTAKTSPNCFACRDARLAQQDWDTAQKNKPTPTAPTAPDPTTCRHKWTDNYCAICLERREEP